MLVGRAPRAIPKFSQALGLCSANRAFAEGRIGASHDELDELLSSNLATAPVKKPDVQPRILTTRREALSLYRMILRYSNLFVWRDEFGRPWRDVIRSSARQEFELARGERDPELVNKMIITGRDAVQKSVEKFMQKRQQMMMQEQQQPLPGPPGL